MLYKESFYVSNSLRDVKVKAVNIRRYMLDITLLNDTRYLNEYDSLINLEEKDIFEKYAEINKLLPEISSEVNLSMRLFEDWRPLRKNVLDMIRKGNSEAAMSNMSDTNRQYVDKLFTEMQKILDSVSAKAEQLYLSTEETQKDITLLMAVLLILSMGTSVLLAYLITRSIVPRLRRVVKSIEAIAEGNLKNELLPESDDETGQLAASYNKMQENLLEKSRVAELIAQGDFNIQVPPAGPKDMLAQSINLISENFSMVVRQAQRIASGDYETEFSVMTKTNSLAIVINQMLSSLKEVVNKAHQIANGDYSGEVVPKSKADELAHALNRMTTALRTATDENGRQSRLKTAQNELNELMRGDLSLEQLSKNVINYLSKFSGALLGAIYLYKEESRVFQLTGSYAFESGKGVKTWYKPGEGLVGQAAMDKEILHCSNLPDNYIKINSALGNTLPKNLIIAPFVYSGKTAGVIEIGSLDGFDPLTGDFLKLVLENIAIAVESANNRTQMALLLDITSKQAQELQVQQEELKQANEELETQTQALRRSEEYLQSQQEELKLINEELEDKTKYLEKQKSQMENQNTALEKAWMEVEKKAKELEITNKYKSEFLANMSHELRTPLNSLLILSQTLMENKEKNLSPEQTESARIIYNSGVDLLNLINDILDLSKIESGKMSVAAELTSISDITGSLRNYFSRMIEEKKLAFEISISPDVPEKIVTDQQRLNQILRNLMSNAVKFTEKGSITISIFKPSEDTDFSRSNLKASETIGFSVKDTGIGIANEKQHEIFEAFQQLDGSISRKYGGTGLGLSITRELTKLLGGEIRLRSQPGKGSEFTIYLPENIKSKALPNKASFNLFLQSGIAEEPGVKTKIVPQSIADDRPLMTKNDSSILIIEDDAPFANMLANICKEKGFKYLVTSTGEEGIELAKKFQPKGILLDINLPGINGWDVLDLLKTDTETRHIPVHIITIHEETIEAFNKGAMGYLSKPVTREKLEETIDYMQSFIAKDIKDLLLIEDDENLRKTIRLLLESKDIKITECNRGAEAIKLISETKYDCMVLDLGLPDMSGFDLLNNLKNNQIKIPPVVVYTGKELTQEENELLQQYTQNIIVKGVKSEERLLDETALFLHRMVDHLPERQKKMLINIYDKDQMFRDRKVLIVDDDMRNVFALTRVLESIQMKVFMAGNGKKALETLQSNPEIDLVLMDIMMPVMDGYEAMKLIRKNKKWEKLPVIALTAKAMKEDREKSIAAGANDYLTKPVDIQKLYNMMRIWLYK